MVEDVEEFESSQPDLMGTIGLVVIFLIIVGGGFSYAYVQRAKELEQYTKHHLDHIAIKKLEVDKKLVQTDHDSEEE